MVDGELAGRGPTRVEITMKATIRWVSRILILISGLAVLASCGGGAGVTEKATIPPGFTAKEAADAGFAHLEQEEYAEAVASYGQALAIDPEYPEAYFNRARAYFELVTYQAAIHDFDQAIAQDPAHAESYYLRAAAYLILDQPERSIDDFDIALELDPGHSSAHFSRAFVYLKLDRDSEAEPDITWLADVLGVDEVTIRERFYRMLNPPP